MIEYQSLLKFFWFNDISVWPKIKGINLLGMDSHYSSFLTLFLEYSLFFFFFQIACSIRMSK